jgi:hypothetical protein
LSVYRYKKAGCKGDEACKKAFIANAKWFCKKVKIDGNFSGFEKLLAGEI